MELSIWKVTFGLHLGKSGSDLGVGASLDFFKTPYWEIEATLQLLLPWELSFRISEKV